MSEHVLPIDVTTWRRVCAGCYQNVAGTRRIQTVQLDDGEWWIVVDLLDGSTSDPLPTYRAAKESVAAELA
jgi:hypothetical protein